MIDHPLARWLRHEDDCMASVKHPVYPKDGGWTKWVEMPHLCTCGLTAALLKEKERWESQST